MEFSEGSEPRLQLCVPHISHLCSLLQTKLDFIIPLAHFYYFEGAIAPQTKIEHVTALCFKVGVNPEMLKNRKVL